MAEHTKGPWIVRDAPYGYDIFVSDVETDRALWIAGITTGPLGRDSRFYPSREACAANARLIAAAPALVTALEFIRDGYDNRDVNHVDYRVKVYQVVLDALSLVNGDVEGAPK